MVLRYMSLNGLRQLLYLYYINYNYNSMTSEASVRNQEWGPSGLGACSLKTKIPICCSYMAEKMLRITRKEQKEMFSSCRKWWCVLLHEIGPKDQGMESQTNRIGCFMLDRNKVRRKSNMMRACGTVGMIKIRTGLFPAVLSQTASPTRTAVT